MEEKVYCNECKWLKEIHTEHAVTKKRSTENQCKAPSNRKAVDSPMGRKEVLERTPEEINKNNDCGWYQASRPKSPKEERGPTVGMRTILDHEKRLVAIENRIFKKPKNKETKNGKASKSGTSNPPGPRGQDSGVGEEKSSDQKET